MTRNNWTKLRWYPVLFSSRPKHYRSNFHSKQIFEKFWEYVKDIYACFVDLEKAYDRVPCEKGVLREYVVDGRLLLAVKSLYSCSEDCVVLRGVKPLALDSDKCLWCHQGRNEVRWRPGKKQVWRPHVQTWDHSDANLLHWRKYLWHFGTFRRPAVIRWPGNCAPLAPLVTPLAVTTFFHSLNLSFFVL